MMAMVGLARVAHARGRDGVAGPMYDEALALAQELLSRPDHRYTLWATRHKAIFLIDVGRAREAIALLNPVLASQRQKLPHPHVDLGGTLYEVARAHFAVGDRERTVQLLEEALSHLVELPAGHALLEKADDLLSRAR